MSFQDQLRGGQTSRFAAPPVGYQQSYSASSDDKSQVVSSTIRQISTNVSQIKQMNHLMSDQEFYGLRVLKLPAKKYGILSDVLVHQINSQQCHPSLADNTPLTVNIGISQHLSHTSADNGLKFLSHMDEDLRRLRQSTETVIQRSAIDNLEQKLSASCDANEVQVVDGKQSVNRSAFLSCDESDYGINWCNLLLLAFVLCFISPIVYVIYISESNHNHNTTDSVHNHILSHH